MLTRVLYGLLALVAGAAAVLSFSALRDLAEACGFSHQLAWLLPVVVDAGAAAGSVVWLGGSDVPDRARGFARVLAVGLLVASVAANALGHVLVAYGLRPHWAVVVAVSAIAPAVLGAVVHLAVLAAGPREHAERVLPISPADFLPVSPGDSPAVSPAGDTAGVDRAAELIAAGAGRRRLSAELGITEHEARLLLERDREEVSA